MSWWVPFLTSMKSIGVKEENELITCVKTRTIRRCSNIGSEIFIELEKGRLQNAFWLIVLSRVWLFIFLTFWLRVAHISGHGKKFDIWDICEYEIFQRPDHPQTRAVMRTSTYFAAANGNLSFSFIELVINTRLPCSYPVWLAYSGSSVRVCRKKCLKSPAYPFGTFQDLGDSRVI